MWGIIHPSLCGDGVTLINRDVSVIMQIRGEGWKGIFDLF